MIHLKTRGGLCNRMRTIVSSVELARRCQEKLFFSWNLNNELNCSFQKLFQPIQDVSINSTVEYRKIWLFDLLGIRKNTSVCNDEIYKKRAEGWQDQDFEQFFRRILLKSNLTLETDWNFFGTTSESYNLFKPVKQLQDQIDNVTSNFSEGIVGVHIRRTDHAIAIVESPLTLFIDALKKEVEYNSRVTFFLATDCFDTQRLMQQTFGERMIVNSKVKNRDSVDGVREAVVDLYCLAGTSKIIGSYWSSFSETASQLSNIPLTILKK
jgi:hypothetical protein